MIDFNALIKYLFKYKWFCLLIPVVSIVLTYFLTKNMPREYVSRAQIATGLTDQSKQLAAGKNLDYYMVSQSFGNIMELMRTRSMINILSYDLMLHDLVDSAQAFRPWSEDLVLLSDEQREATIQVLQGLRTERHILSQHDHIGEYRLLDIVTSMGYDEYTLGELLMIYRNNESDFISVEFSSENPELSAFVVNTFATGFIDYHQRITYGNQNQSLALLDSLLRDKEMIMNQKDSRLRSYRASGGLINSGSQAEALYGQISAREASLAEAKREIAALNGAINRINSKLSDENDADLGSTVSRQNNEIVAIDRLLTEANKRYADNGFLASDKRVVDSLQDVRREKVLLASQMGANNPQAVRESLINERLELETSLARYENSLASIQFELNQLNDRFYRMVPASSDMQNIEREAEAARNDYMDALARYNQAKLENSTSLRLALAEPGLPGPPEPSKKILYLAASGAGTFSLCLAVIFVMFIIDRRIFNAKQLNETIGGKVLGSINLIHENDKDLRTIWDNKNETEEYNIYRELLRSIRFEISAIVEKEGCKIVGVTSLADGAGKTFVASSLAYAFAMTNKKVLLIGENYTSLTNLITNRENNKVDEENHQFEKFLVKKEIQTEDRITILSRKGQETSLLEMNDAKGLKSGFDYLKSEFNLIIIDVNSLRDSNNAKEWLLFSELKLAVFPSGAEINSVDRELADFVQKQPGFIGWIVNKVKVNPRNGALAKVS